jgi:hypothetical protein
MSRRPPCPDPENYIWVHTEDGGYWRRKRGSVKPAKLNMQFKEGNELMKIAAPAAKRIVQKLRAFLDRMKTGRLNATISGKIRKALSVRGVADFCFFDEFELHRNILSGLCLMHRFNVLLKMKN